jgi:hypothetical protein
VVAQETNADKAIYGTWANPEYNKMGRAKLVMQPDDVMLSYIWTMDEKHDVWYTFTLEHTSWEYFLVRISNTGRVYEEIVVFTEFATEIDPGSRHYRIYFRQ